MYIYIFVEKNVTRILSAFRWDVSRNEVEIETNLKNFLEFVVLLMNFVNL